MNSAKKLLQFNFDADAFARRAPQPAKPNQQNLDILEEIVKEHGNDGYEPWNQEDLGQIYHLFIQANQDGRLRQEFSTSKRIRQLAWVLTFSENDQPRIVDTPQLQDALKLIETRFRTSSLFGVFYTLMQEWDTPNAYMLRSFVKKHLTKYSGTRKSVQKLKVNMNWYCENDSTTQLATTLLRSNKRLSEVWSFLELPEWTHTYRYFGAVATAFVSSFRHLDSVQTGVETHTLTGFVSFIKHLDREVIVDVINFLEKHNNDKTNLSVLSILIEQLGLDAPEGFRAPVQSYVLRKWKDPRIAGADKSWRGVSDKAREIFTKWLTEADLEFFFNIVAKACEDEKFAYRKAFWFAYLEYITFCRPVLRKDVENLFIDDRETLKFYSERCPAALTGGNRNQHAFIIQIGNHTCVEFSTAGACYVYHNDDLPFELGRSEYYMHELRNQDWAVHRVIHPNSENYYWQREFAKWIEGELGIPVQNFEL